MALLKDQALERLTVAWKTGRFAHAYLLSAPPGAGKQWLALHLASLVLETSPEKTPAHPDFHQVGPESKSRRIVIEQMRTMEHDLQMKPMIGRTKVAVIQEADRLQPQAANAFLKTLEEPPPGCHIFLLTAVPDAVMETIVSRCIIMTLRSRCRTEPGADECAVAEALTQALAQAPDVASAMRFTRVFQKAIATVRERVTDELESDLKRELKHYRDAAGAKWEEDRENQIKAQAEAAIVRERQSLLHAAEEVLAAALRHHHLPDQKCPEKIQRVAAANSPQVLLKRLAALERTRDLLARGVQESLALESGFLEMIAIP